MFSVKEHSVYEMLDKYRSSLTDSQYKNIKSVIANQLLEGIYPTQKNFEIMVSLVTNKKTSQEILQEILESYKTSRELRAS